MPTFSLFAAPIALLACSIALAAQAPSDPPPTVKPVPASPDKRVAGILPNYRAAVDTGVYTPIPASRKFYIATRDSFDYPVVILAGVLAGAGQARGSNPDYGYGMKGYGKRVAANYADQVLGNYFAEAIFPSMLRQDPRYFLHPQGSVGARLRYALTRVLITRTDSGKTSFNFSEIGGNATAVALSNAYYPMSRTAGANAEKLAINVGLDAASNVMKEFWPDIKKKFFTRKQP